jgi:hypothetical protein
MAPSGGTSKDIRKIAKQTKKLGKKIADEGTYKNWVDKNTHEKVSWDYNGKHFFATFGNTTSNVKAVIASKQQIRKSLKEIGFPNTPDFLRLEPTLTADEREINEIVEELYRLLDEDDE